MPKGFLLALVCSLGACAAPSAPKARFAHTFVFLRSGPERAKYQGEALQELMNGHMANIGRLASEHELYVAGPFGKPSPTPELRGLFVFATGDVERARELTASDPSVAAGVFECEVVPWSTDKDLHGVHRRDMEFEARRKADPSIEMTQGMSSYVAIFAEDAALASKALSALRKDGRIAVEGRFGGERLGQGLYVLDTRDATAAEALLAPVKAALGPCTIVPWWGSAELSK
ncbi:MAG: hypothetical protein IT454_01545 [Planctomycetes bacterium]|nr:hypothetical protein [Planctomycetota bacterium]